MSNETDISVLEVRTTTLETTVTKIENMMERIQERPPVWCTWVMTIGGSFIGALVTWLISCMR